MKPLKTKRIKTMTAKAPQHPGKIIEKHLLDENLTIAQFHKNKSFSFSVSTLARIVKGTRGITKKTAQSLASATNSDPGMWLKQQNIFNGWSRGVDKV
jgi:addiction module HigA family antidote